MTGKIVLSKEEIETAYRKHDLDEAATRLGVSIPTLRKRMKEHGIVSHAFGWRKGTAIDRETLIALYKKRSVPEIADLLRVNRKTVYSRMREYGLRLRTRGPRKTFDFPSKELFNLYVKNKLSVVEIADHYGVGASLVIRRLDELGLSRNEIEKERERRKHVEVKMKVSYSARMWKRAILQRDDFTCRKCGLKSGKCNHCGQSIFLHVHHKKPISTHPELRFKLSNGTTLCRTCHAKEHRQGIG